MGQWGFDKTAPAGGTTPEDVQRIFAAEWYNADQSPVIAGGTVTGRADLRYNYAAGVGLVRTALGNVKVTWPAGTTALVTQPAVTRVDIVYVDSAGLVRVGTQGVVDESNVCVMDRMALPAGATMTNGASRAHTRNFAIPYGASLGYIMGYQEWRTGPVPQAETMFTGGFWVPTDSWIDMHVIQGIHTDIHAGYGIVHYRVELNGEHLEDFELPYSSGMVSTEKLMRRIPVVEGDHTVKVSRLWWNGDQPYFFHGGVEKLPGGGVSAAHMGVRQ